MSENETSPLLSAPAQDHVNAQDRDESAESAPLLSSSSYTPRYDGEHDEPEPERDDAASTRSRRCQSSSIRSSKKKSRRWPSFIAMGILAVMTVIIIVLAFIVPETVQEYAQQAAVIEPTNLSLDSITTDGVRARIQANFRLDGSKVENDHVRRVGKAATWVAYKLGTDQTKVDVYLPDYENILLGSAVVPPLVIKLREGDTTHFDFVTEIQPGNVEGIRMIANEWLEGRLDELRLDGTADLSLKSGIIPLGKHTVSESLVFEANKIPAIPKYNITRFNVKDGPFDGSMLADVSLSAFNEYPVELDIPELAFDILVPGCDITDPYILVAEASTGEIHVEPHSDVAADVYGVIRGLPDSLTRACPHSSSSPLDMLLKQYMHGDPATLFVRGSSHPDGETPKWIADILSSITLPVPFPGRTLDGLIRNFSLTDVHFTLPDPFADPDDPDSNPKVSGNILVTAGLPSEMNFGINVTNVRATANVLYHNRKMGELDLRKWQQANSTRVEGEKDEEPTLRIESRIIEAPLNVTDSDVFSELVQALLFGGKPIRLDVEALVDVKVVTSLGKLIVKELPAEGKIPVKPLAKGAIGSLNPKVGSLRILDTTPDSITLQALVNVTNPTPYTAHVPFANIHILKNGSLLGDATVENLDIVKGPNSHVLVTAKWKPSMGGTLGPQIGKDLISQYLSGWNTTITVKAHRDSIPGQPLICEALSRFNMTVAAPKMDLPGDTSDEKTHFIRDATFHFLSSTASFTLASPMHYNTLYVDFVNATALYNHTEPMGKIIYDLPFSAPPGVSQTPRLPVEWSLDSVGYDAVRKAIGGRLKLDAYADVDVRLGNWKESLWYQGKGIGAKVQL
ncbi:Uu.00g067460.m01.CDS01 [Anthostomella pinea]|uniref:Uu.00g067460.m01.CDS01 n=1 Tax=Anthostomella pinea TaxID=933095 RepID=A0AAI8YNH7_9PEZI|nr:Uu.00g067460.m01.CDS01 [Anthostomella pinea]